MYKRYLNLNFSQNEQVNDEDNEITKRSEYTITLACNSQSVELTLDESFDYISPKEISESNYFNELFTEVLDKNTLMDRINSPEKGKILVEQLQEVINLSKYDSGTEISLDLFFEYMEFETSMYRSTPKRYSIKFLITKQ